MPSLTKAAKRFGWTVLMVLTSITQGQETGSWPYTQRELSALEEKLRLCCREAKVFLHCNKSLKTGDERLTTTGDSKTKLSYVSFKPNLGIFLCIADIWSRFLIYTHAMLVQEAAKGVNCFCLGSSAGPLCQRKGKVYCNKIMPLHIMHAVPCLALSCIWLLEPLYWSFIMDMRGSM